MRRLAVRLGEATLPVELSVRQAAELLGFPERTVRRMCARGLIPTLATRPYRIATVELCRTFGVTDYSICLTEGGK